MPDTFDLNGPWPTGRAPVESWTWQANTTTGNIDIVAIGTTPPALDTIGNIQILGGGSYNVGDSFSLIANHAGSVASSSLSYSWTLNGVAYTGPGSNTNTIYIASATTADSGTWVCTVTASNTVVSDSPQTGTATATVTAAITIGTVLVVGGGTFAEGSSFTLTATNSGNATGLSYAWDLNGTPYPGAPNAPDLVINPAALSDTGTWTCTISSNATGVQDSPQSGSDSTTVLATIGSVQINLAPPEPTGGYVPGTTVTATATHTGTSQNVSWTDFIPGATSGNTNTVTIQSISAANSGQWFFDAYDANAFDGPGPIFNSVSVNVATASPLLDTYSGDFVAAYSLQKLSSTWPPSGGTITGVVRVKEDNTNTEADIDTTSGKLDEWTLAMHCNAGQADGTAVTWYDQTGNGHHVSQSTATAQPKIFNGGNTNLVVYDALNFQAALEFDGSNDYFSLVNASLGSQPFTIFTVISTTPSTRVRVIAGLDGGNRLWIDTTGANPTVWRINSGTSATSSTGVSASAESYITTTEFNGSSSNMWVRAYNPNGFPSSSSVQVLSNVNAGNKGITKDLIIGSNPGKTIFHGGLIQEVLIADKIFSATDRAAIENEIAARY